MSSLGSEVLENIGPAGEWLDRSGVGPLFIELGSPWENGYCESFNGRLRDEPLNWEIFYTLTRLVTVV